MLDPLLPGRLGLYLSMVQYAVKYNRAFAHEHYQFFLNTLDFLGSLDGKKILDVGCGKSFWLTLLLHSKGANMTGVDKEIVMPGFSFRKYKSVCASNGIERAFRTFFWEQAFAKPYYQELATLCDFTLNFDGIDLVPVINSKINFPKNTFDYVVSHEVFEHIENLDSTLENIWRVIKPNGKTYIYIHSHTSISGGHHIAWKYPDSEPSKIVPPWDHLRSNQYPDIPSWLNKLRIDDYQKAFSKYFDIVDWIPSKKEGAQLLTTEIRNELSEYSETELLTKGFTVVATPKDKN